MLVDLYYGKVSKMSSGDIDILLAKNVELKNAQGIIKENLKLMKQGWGKKREGDKIVVIACNETFYEIIKEIKL